PAGDTAPEATPVVPGATEAMSAAAAAQETTPVAQTADTPTQAPADTADAPEAVPAVPAQAEAAAPAAVEAIEAAAPEAAEAEPDAPEAQAGAAADTPGQVDAGPQLKAMFPALFSNPPKPLKLRIQADIQQRAPGTFTRPQLSAFLRRY